MSSGYYPSPLYNKVVTLFMVVTGKTLLLTKLVVSFRKFRRKNVVEILCGNEKVSTFASHYDVSRFTNVVKCIIIKYLKQ